MALDRDSSVADFGKEEADLQDFLRLVLKRWKLMVVVSTVILLAAIAYIFIAQRVWEASVTVKLPADNASDPLKELVALSSAASQADPIITYMQVAQSFNVAIRAARSVELLKYKQFSKMRDLESAAQFLLSKKIVQVSNVKESDILQFDVKVHNPDLAMLLANAWAQAFIDANLDFERIGASSQHAFMTSQLVSLKSELTSEEEALERLSQSQGMLHPQNSDIGGGMGGSDLAMLNPVLSLQTRVQDLLIEKSELAIQYRPDYPGIKEINAEYKSALEQLNRQLRKLPEDDMNYARLDREVQADVFIYDLLLQKDQEARIEQNVDNSGIVVVDAARLPGAPVWPMPILVITLAIILAVLSSVVLASAIERWSDEIGSEQELSRLGRLPLLAMISDWRVELGEAEQMDAKSAEDGRGLICEKKLEFSYFSESFKTWRTNLSFCESEKKIRSFCVLSANSGDGKTLLNANLALALALTGKKVVLVDADLRKSSVHKLFGVEVKKDQGLPFLLSGQDNNLQNHIVPGPIPNFSLLPCGVRIPNPSELLGSDSFDSVLKILLEKYDQVIFDVCPVLPVTDGVIVAKRLDGAALAARFEKTRRVEFERALETLRVVKVPLVGAILNSVDIKKYSYIYGYSYKYYSYHTKNA